MACHAVVHRMLLESLGLMEPPSGSQVSLLAMTLAAQLDMSPCFADDAIWAGPSTEVLRSLQHLQGELPSVGLRFSSLVVAPAAGRSHGVGAESFIKAGCRFDVDAHVDGALLGARSQHARVALCRDRAQGL